MEFDGPSERARGFLTKSHKAPPSLACAVLTAGKLSYGIEAVAKACRNNEQKVKKSGEALCTAHIR
ncbi:MAG: hypothetical protein ACREDA_08430, partial [Methylocella sp.]